MKESDFQFKNPILEQLVFDINPDFTSNETNVEMENVFGVHINKDIQAESAIVKLEIFINSEKEDTPFKIQAVVSSMFVWNNLSEDEVDRMLNTNAPALLLSYARPIISSITNFSPFPTYNLPFMNFK